VASTPLNQVSPGILPTTPINNIVNYVNTLFGGLGQIATGVASAPLSLTTSNTDVASASVTVTSTGANGILVSVGTFGFSCTVASAGSYFVGDCVVDGTSQGSNGDVLCPADQTYAFDSRTKMWVTTVSAGSHTAKLQARKSAAGPTGTAVIQHTNIVVILFDMP